MGKILLTVPELSMTDWQVCLLGVGTVFVGLIIIILICKLLGMLIGKIDKDEKKTDAAIPSQTQTSSEEIPNREEFVAAISAALAEYMGEDVNSFRIVSIKKI